MPRANICDSDFAELAVDPLTPIFSGSVLVKAAPNFNSLEQASR